MMKKPSPSPADEEDAEFEAYIAATYDYHGVRCDCGGGFWTSLETDIVYNCRDGGDGSMPRDIYDDDPEHQKRTALHAEVLGPLRTLLALEAAERDRLNTLAAGAEQISLVEQCRRHLERVKAIRGIMDAHRLTDSAD
jgi:hypothetical protein